MNILNRFTLQTLKKNKIRTLVTIIGIILSTSMFTAVTSIIISLQQYMVNIEIETSGAWHGRIQNLTKEEVQKLQKEDEVTKSSTIYNIGYALLEDSINEDKPYLCIESIDSSFTELSALHLTEGRMPKNSSELLISEHLEQNGNVSYKLGDTLKLQVGNRKTQDGEILGQESVYTSGIETLADTREKEYTIVGVCERPAFESYSAPGYSAFTISDADYFYSCDVLFQVKTPEKITDFIENFTDKAAVDSSQGISYEIHSGLLRSIGASPDANYMSVLRNIGGLLIAIIMIASVSLIYNAFSISVTERTKQFGLLKSIGATKKQIRRSVLFEAFSLCLIGIPVGIGCGLLGIGITLHFVGDLTAEFMSSAAPNIKLRLYISIWAILPAAIIALVTVLISAMLPARRAVKLTAIQALRESSDIKAPKRGIKSGRLVYRLFGFEGMLANKNLKRNRKKHRLTVASLAISVFLFLSTSSFSNYMMVSNQVIDTNNVDDIAFTITRDEIKNSDCATLKRSLEELKGVDAVAYSLFEKGYISTAASNLNPDYLKQIRGEQSAFYDSKNDKYTLDAYIYYIDDDTYRKFLEKHNLSTGLYLNNKNPIPLVWDNTFLYLEDGSYFFANMFKENKLTGDLYAINQFKKLVHTGIENYSDMSLRYETLEEENPKQYTYKAEKALTLLSSAGMKHMDSKLPLGGNDSRYNGVVGVTLPYSAIQALPKENTANNNTMLEFQLQAKNYKATTATVTDFFKNSKDYSTHIASLVINTHEGEDANTAFILIVNIFSYGFIFLITLIVIANVFNTISTNIQLRRKEFAMLKSVGMTQKGFDRMMNYECILYGVKGLLIGIPASFGMSYLIYKALRLGWSISFEVPVLSLVIVCLSVFIIVFASMLYSMRKIKKDNPIEALRNDNL